MSVIRVAVLKVQRDSSRSTKLGRDDEDAGNDAHDQ